MGDKLLLKFWREISALIYNFTRETFPMSQYQDGVQV